MTQRIKSQVHDKIQSLPMCPNFSTSSTSHCCYAPLCSNPLGHSVQSLPSTCHSALTALLPCAPHSSLGTLPISLLLSESSPASRMRSSSPSFLKPFYFHFN